MKRRTRELNKDELIAVASMYEWFAGNKEPSPDMRQRIRVFFQDTPMGSLRIEEEQE